MAHLFALVGILAVFSSVKALVEPEYPLVTPAPNITLAALQERDLAGSICGYVNADPNSPVSCEGTSICTYQGVGGHWGCCGALSCSTPGTCEPEGRPYCGGVGTVNCVYPQILQCSGASPACVTYTRKTASTAEIAMTSWGCGPTPTTYAVFAFTTAGGAIETSIGTSGGAEGSTSTSGGGSLPGSSSAPAEPSSSGGGGLSTDAKIALGVGIPATVAAILGTYFTYRYRQQRRS